jgi:subtilisin family serine protease
MLIPLITSLASPLIAQGADAPGTDREVVTRADQLPRRNYSLGLLPSAYLRAPLAQLAPLGALLEADLLADLSRYDIRDPSALSEIYTHLAALVELRGDWAAVPGWTAKARALQEKPGAKVASGVLTDLLARQRLEQRDLAWLGTEIERVYGAMAWADVKDIVRSNKGSIETFSPELLDGAFQSQLDPVAVNGSMSVPAAVALAIVSSRVQIELLGPNKAAVVAGLQAVVDANDKVGAGEDIWTPSTFAIPAGAKASPVVIAVWDSGVDLRLFTPAAARGMAFDENSDPATDLLRPLGEAQARWPQLRSTLKGAMDQRAALDTADSREFRAKLAGLKADQVKAFSEDMSLVGLYVHGTHVAGIAVDGNPFAQVYAGTMLWSARIEPAVPSEARSRATAAAYRAMVKGFQDAGVRVVNMSWRYGPSAYEQSLAHHNLGGSPDARKQEALRLFKIERDALRDAIAGAPEIFFVAGSGNEDNSADFEEYIPAGLELPNLITVGAVDRSGAETSFSTFGKTVVVHANGFEVDGPVPGGEHLKLSGTSMASPQVANLAAKLIALKPELTPVQVKALILDGARRLPTDEAKPGRVNLIDPRRSAALAGLTV